MWTFTDRTPHPPSFLISQKSIPYTSEGIEQVTSYYYEVICVEAKRCACIIIRNRKDETEFCVLRGRAQAMCE